MPEESNMSNFHCHVNFNIPEEDQYDGDQSEEDEDEEESVGRQVPTSAMHPWSEELLTRTR